MTSADLDNASPTAKPRGKLRRYLGLILRWVVAIVGIVWILSQITFRDRVNVVLPDGSVKTLALLKSVSDKSEFFDVETIPAPVPRGDLVSRPDRKEVELISEDVLRGNMIVKLLGMHLDRTDPGNPHADALQGCPTLACNKDWAGWT